MFNDVRGLALTADNSAAVTQYSAAIDALMEYRLSASVYAKEAVQLDPEFVMAHCLRACFALLMSAAVTLPAAARSLAIAQTHAAKTTDREQLHVKAIEHWLNGDMHCACAQWEDIVAQYPLDLLALRLHHFASFWRGRSFALRDLILRALPSWQASIPGYGNVLGMAAFGFEECGNYAQAERLGKQAVEHNHDDLWSVHAVAHVFESTGRLKEGLDWLDYPFKQWEDRNPFRSHLWWHRALYLHELGQYEAVLALYDATIRDEKSDFYLDIQNQASLLYRLELQGVSVGARWGELADHIEPRCEDHVLAFTDLHSAMALAAADRPHTLNKFLTSLREFATTPQHFAAEIAVDITLPLCEVIVALRQARYATAVEKIRAIRADFTALGASHTQRDIIAQLNIAANIGAGDLIMAKSLLHERIQSKAHSAGTWAHYAKVLHALDEVDAQQHALQQHARIVQEGKTILAEQHVD